MHTVACPKRQIHVFSNQTWLDLVGGKILIIPANLINIGWETTEKSRIGV